MSLCPCRQEKYQAENSQVNEDVLMEVWVFNRPFLCGGNVQLMLGLK